MQEIAAAYCSRHNRDVGKLFEFKLIKTVNIAHPIGESHSFLLFPNLNYLNILKAFIFIVH